MSAPVKVVPLNFVPSTVEEWAWALKDAMWRVCSGQLYKIMVKTPGGDGESVQPFKPNRSQKRFMSRLWHRNIILKARQLGFTTLIAILWLDHALFNENQRCVIVAQDRDKAEEIFRDKVTFAYERMPLAIRLSKPIKTSNKSEILFKNNSAIKVSTSARGGTPHRLHISEMGKIGAKFPIKAKEIVTGSFPAVPMTGVIVVESTAEGQEGQFYKMTQSAMAVAELGTKLNPRDFRFHFFPWHAEEHYRLNAPVLETQADRDYFELVETEAGIKLDRQQRAWYLATRKADFADDEELMWQEYPSFPNEAFQVSTEGTYYAKQMTQMRRQKRVGFFPYVEGIPVNTFWDIGGGDGTGIWLHQRIGAENRFIGYIEGWGEGYSYYGMKLSAKEYLWGTHYLPHDAGHKRQQGESLVAPIDELEKLAIGGKWAIVPRVEDINTGIQMTRAKLSQCTFDAEGCKEGLIHLGAYRKEWDENRSAWKNKPRHDEHSEAADAIRQFAQGYVPPKMIAPAKATRAAGWRAA